MSPTLPVSPSDPRANGASPSRSFRGALSHDGEFWRRLARFGAARMPEWWMHYSPPFFGLAAAVLVPKARKNVRKNLARIRGSATPMTDLLQVAETFTTYASCLSETLAYGSKNEGMPELELHNRHHMAEALEDGKGVVMTTAHTAGWDVAGPLFGRNHHVDLVLVMERERSAGARQLHDDARAASGMSFVHVGDDALSSLPILKHLRRGAVIAIQLDRVPPGMRGREVRLFGRAARIPEGPVRLARGTGAPIVPMFCARLGFRRYRMEVYPPLRLPRDADDDALGAACQRVADAMEDFLVRHPTQWFHFSGES